MRKVNVTLLALVAVCLVVAPLAFGQGGNPPAATNQSGTTWDHRATAGSALHDHLVNVNCVEVPLGEKQPELAASS